jgi:hypothetical protein
MDVPSHRADLPQLLAENPNYFGNLPGSGLKPVTEILADTNWEELIGVGYAADRQELEATFAIKQDAGYGGGLCTSGSWEYVRFFVNTGSGWEDAGLAGVNVHDLPDGEDCTGAARLPVSYIARMSYQPARDLCFEPLLPQVRAILSWSVPPPSAGSAPQDWTPVFGNVFDDYVQIPPRPFVLADVMATLKVSPKTLPASMAAGLQAPIQVPPPAPLSLAALAADYGPQAHADDQNAALAVPAHRFAAAELATAAAAPVPDQQTLLASMGTWKSLGLDWSASIGDLLALDGDTSYEQIDCLGLDLTLPRLVATITIKQPAGYNGGLCTGGSTEYVAFWADLGPDCSLTYLGTAPVSVHDIGSIPAGGLNYAAVLPVDLSGVQRSCDEPFLMRVRAVLSWAVPPSTTDPDAVPYWGNVVNAHVQVPVLSPGSGTSPSIFCIGGIGVESIDSSYDAATMTTSGTGLTTPGAHFFGSGIPTNPLPSPFGGLVVINGVPVPGGSYRIQVRDLSAGSGPWITLTNPVTVGDSMGGTSLNSPVSDYYPYQPVPQNEFSALADWYPPGQPNDLWEIKLDARDAAANPLGEVRYRIQLDNTAPVCDLQIDNGGDCKKFAGTTTITGHVHAADPQGYPASYGIWIEPANLPGGTGALSVPPSAATGQTAPEPGDPWQLDTSGMSPCAYTVLVQAANRVIVNSAYVGFDSPIAAVGFALGV